MSDTIDTLTTQVDGHEVTFTLYPDTDTKPSDFDCYSYEDVDAWKRDLWEFVVVEASMPYGRTRLGGVEYGQLGPLGIDVKRIVADHGSDMLAEILADKPHPVGGEPFGTAVTFWSAHWGVKHAIITSSPKPEGEREFLDTTEWGIVIKGSGMTFVPADQLTLGWHPEAEGGR